MLVKKYSNRRLYDTQSSRYITLEELAEKIRAGAEARVVDAASGEDLTQSTLTQIIIEGRGAARLLPVPLLTQLIRMGDDALAEFLGRYMSNALELYLQAKQGAQALAPYNPFATTPFSATSALARLLMGGGMQQPQGFGGFGWGEPAPAPPPPPASPPPPAPSARDAGEDVKDLRRELDELKEAMLAAAKGARRKGTPAVRPVTGAAPGARKPARKRAR